VNSPDDEICLFEMAKEADKLLKQNGAKVKLLT
jgi:hypothetical protein